MDAVPSETAKRRSANSDAAEAGSGMLAGRGRLRRPLLERRVVEIALCGLFLIALIDFLRSAAPLLAPMTAAVLIGSVIGPLADRIGRIGIPSYVVGTAMLAFLVGLGYLIATGVAPSLSSWIGRAPEAIELVRNRLAFAMKPLAALGGLFSEAPPAVGPGATGGVPPGVAVVAVERASDTGPLAAVLHTVSPALAEFGIFFGTFVFFLVGRSELRRRVVLSFRDRDRRFTALKMIGRVETALSDYVVTVALINAGFGFAVGLVLAVVGVANPVLWGVLAGLLNFLPYIGSLTMMAVLIAVGLISYDPGIGGLIPVAAYGLVHLVENVVTPTLVGRRIEMNAFLVFSALAFWTWAWGPLGAFLAVPLLVVGIVLARELLVAPLPALPE